MRVIKSFTFLFIILAILFACKKKATEVNPEFEGVWEASNRTLSIDGDSDALYQKTGRTSETVSGNARVKEDKLKVGPFKKFKIDQHPEELSDTTNANDRWKMVLDGVTYITYK